MAGCEERKMMRDSARTYSKSVTIFGMDKDRKRA